MSSPKIINSRLTVVEQVSYQGKDQDPVTCVTRYVVPSHIAEQPYDRRWVLPEGRQWTRLPNCEWMEHVSLMILSNIEGKTPLQRNPTAQERQDASRRVVDVRWMDKGCQPSDLDGAHSFIPPGEGMRLRPGDCWHVWIRSPAGPARLHLTLFPGDPWGGLLEKEDVTVTCEIGGDSNGA